MKWIKTFAAIACAFTLMTAAALADQSCCVKEKAKGKDCKHPCCVEAHKQAKTCEKCQPKPTCCDKAIAKGKPCEMDCCIAATKAGKICEKCNKPEKK